MLISNFEKRLSLLTKGERDALDQTIRDLILSADESDDIVCVPGDNGLYHISDNNGGTICGHRNAPDFLDARPDRICDECADIQDQKHDQT